MFRIPFYYFFKTLFLLFLALPQTQGSTFIYSVHLAPLLRGHEDQIDSALAQVKLTAYEFIQEKLRAIWGQLVGSGGAGSGSMAPASVPNVAAVNPPSMADPLSGAAQFVSGWWNAYAPAIIANGAAYIASRQQAADVAAQRYRSRPSAGATKNSSREDSKESVLARRRALEAELAALPQMSPAPPQATLEPLRGNSFGSKASGSSYSLNAGDIRNRKESGSDEDAGRYETIGKDDVTSGSDESPTQTSGPRTSWWGWRGSSYQGYERVKTD